MKKLFFTLVFIVCTSNVLPQCFEYYWHCPSCTKGYAIDGGMPVEFHLAIHSAASEWNSSFCVNFQQAFGGSESGKIYWVNLGEVDCSFGGTLGLNEWTLELSYDGEWKIVYCKTYINSHSSCHWTTSSPGANEHDFQSAMTHEFGHWLGLGEAYNWESTMGWLSCGEVRRGLTSDAAFCAAQLCDIGNNVEDYIFIFDNYPSYPNIYFVNEIIYGRLESNFVDNFPYGDYIEDWGKWQVVALSTCGEILVYQTPGYGSQSAFIDIPPLPKEYNWVRDNGYVLAKVRTTGVDNTGYIHNAEFDTRIGGVPPNSKGIKKCIAPVDYYSTNIYPNPFNPSTTIKYQIPEDGIVSIKIYDVLGKEIATLVNEEKEAGNYEVSFNGSDLASGIYIYRIQVNDFVSSKKMMLLK